MPWLQPEPDRCILPKQKLYSSIQCVQYNILNTEKNKAHPAPPTPDNFPSNARSFDASQCKELYAERIEVDRNHICIILCVAAMASEPFASIRLVTVELTIRLWPCGRVRDDVCTFDCTRTVIRSNAHQPAEVIINLYVIARFIVAVIGIKYF